MTPTLTPTPIPTATVTATAPLTRTPNPTLNSAPIEVTSQGQVKKLKSFLRWCYNGPPLARADSVSVTWEEM